MLSAVWSGTAVAVKAFVVILALNETRKTLIASGLQKASGGFSLEANERAAVDLLFLDENSRVIDSVSDLRPGAPTPAVVGAVSVLELPGGTIRYSQTEKGDRIAIEAVNATTRGDSVGRRSRVL